MLRISRSPHPLPQPIFQWSSGNDRSLQQRATTDRLMDVAEESIALIYECKIYERIRYLLGTIDGVESRTAAAAFQKDIALFTIEDVCVSRFYKFDTKARLDIDF